ncbi:8-oxoguanine deaminase [candidate division WOR-3 bacterium JGI_Cruoil_03_44_89]|uniref:8-oxoguanine deaminase n=1 Tax=candidate division WOR-3 bacterium JGI_Cruoil_03_44_89 TaxID=1973748 RepID=A0A235BT26_UNCW3|nr:MAG: 8-oxoguanine deaminase [candidate division WOR-3 bacterium JGI_Cruoil_03_44_89]
MENRLSKSDVPILIKNVSFIVTPKAMIEDCDIYIEGVEIKSISHNIEPSLPSRVIDGRGKIVIPGLVNTHHHLYQTLTRNIPLIQNKGLFEWLNVLYNIWQGLNPEAIYTSALVGFAELLLTGCTTTSDHLYVFPPGISDDFIDEEVRAAAKMGIRFHPLRGSMSRGRSEGGLPPDNLVESEDSIIKESERIISKFHNPNRLSMCRVGLAPCSPFSVTERLLKDTLLLARDKGVRCHTHLAETIDEENYCKKIYGMRPVEYMEKLGWLGEDISFAHCVWLNDEEIKLLSETETGVVHCPTSNLRLGSGIASIDEMLKAEVRIGLGVDGSASNDSSDMLGELRQASLLHNNIPTKKIFEMATSAGAAILGRDDIGTIEPGKAADLVLIDLRKIGYAGAMRDPLSAIVLCGDSHIVDTTIVNGVVVVEDGKLVNIDEEKLFEEANRISRELLKKAKIGCLSD